MTTTTLALTPEVWGQLRYLYHNYDREVGLFGQLNKEAFDNDGRLLVEGLWVPSQVSGPSTIDIDDDGVSSMVEGAMEQGIEPWQLRVFIHNHPGMPPSPSKTDYETFRDALGTCDWAIMLIWGHDDKVTCLLRRNDSPPVEVSIGLTINWSGWGPGMSLDDAINGQVREGSIGTMGAPQKQNGEPTPTDKEEEWWGASLNRGFLDPDESIYDEDNDERAKALIAGREAPIDADEQEIVTNAFELKKAGFSDEEISQLLEVY